MTERQRVTRDDQLVTDMFDVGIPTTVNRIEFKQVGMQGCVTTGIVEQNDIVERAARGKVTQQQLADATETVEGDTRH